MQYYYYFFIIPDKPQFVNPFRKKEFSKEKNMKKLAVMVYEVQEKDLPLIPEGFPVLIWDIKENTIKLARKGVDPLPPLKRSSHKCLLYKEPPALSKKAGKAV